MKQASEWVHGELWQKMVMSDYHEPEMDDLVRAIQADASEEAVAWAIDRQLVIDRLSRELDDLQEMRSVALAKAETLLAACKSARDFARTVVARTADVPSFNSDDHVIVRKLTAAIEQAGGR